MGALTASGSAAQQSARSEAAGSTCGVVRRIRWLPETPVPDGSTATGKRSGLRAGVIEAGEHTALAIGLVALPVGPLAASGNWAQTRLRRLVTDHEQSHVVVLLPSVDLDGFEDQFDDAIDGQVPQLFDE